MFSWFFKEKEVIVNREFKVRFEDNVTPAEDFSKVQGREKSFSDNSVTTARYNVFTFLPRALFEQFRRLANVYFLVISVLMILGTYTTWFDSPITPWSTLATLMIVVAIAMGKEGFEDWKRHKADMITNRLRANRYNSLGQAQGKSILDETTWSSLRVGNLIKVYNNEEVPADVILLTSSEPFGNAYVETANIDGESNLKLKSSARTGETGPRWETEKEWTTADMVVKCELPNPAIHRFNGSLFVNGQETGLNESSLLLRGCRLKNTAWAVGLVVYTGKQTKVIMNSRPTPSKLSLLEKTMNSLILLVFSAQIILSLISFVSYLIWYGENEDNLTYLCINADSSVNSILRDFCEDSSEYSEAGYIVTFFILYNNFIPISLYVTIELCNYLQAFFIDQDIDLYHPESDMPAIARTSNMNSDLGMIEYIFSDKTGTLTDNIMNFQKISFGGRIFSLHPQKNEDTLDNLRMHATQPDSPAAHLSYVLSVCHTVILDSHTQELRAESPDEEALVKGGGHVGWRFSGRRPGKCSVEHQNEVQDFDVLATIPFDSTRKRMSVVVRTSVETGGKYFVLSKGADNIMFDLATPDDAPLLPPVSSSSAARPSSSDKPSGESSPRATSTGAASATPPAAPVSAREALINNLHAFSSEGLRTLVLGVRELSEAEYSAFAEQWALAERATSDRDRLQAEAALLVEKHLTIVGATAIEDKLQEGVPDTIAFLLQCGIKLWVLTGDKMETAINIGYSAKLLTSDMVLLKMQYQGDARAVNHKLRRLIAQLQRLTESAIQVDLPRRPQVWYKQVWQQMQSTFTDNKGSSSRRPSSSHLHSTNSGIGTGLLSGRNSRSNSRTNSKLFFGSGGDSLDIEHEDMPLLEKPADLTVDRITSEHLGLVVDGNTLLNIFGHPENEVIFLTVAKMCKTIIACRVSPEQKRLLVRLVKRGVFPRPLTLSIGDGANDVPMIQEAEVGVGVSGKEGRQAVNSSDFAIAQFRFLQRLLMVHGRWNYRRTSKVVLYSFYKNIVLALTMFYYTFFSGYSGQTMYDSNVYGMYNIVLSMPVVCFGIFDRDVPATRLLRHPNHYDVGRKRSDLNWLAVFTEMWQAIVDSVLLFFLPYYCYRGSRDIWAGEGYQEGMWAFGLTVYTIIVIAMMLRVMLISYSWTWVWHFFLWGSLALYVLFIFVYQYFESYSYDFYAVSTEAMSQPIFWALLVVVCFLSISVKMVLELLPVVFSLGIHRPKKVAATTREEDFGGDDEEHRGIVSWLSLSQWHASMPTTEQEALGVLNTQERPLSSYNYDHVTTSLGPGASSSGDGVHPVQRFFQDAGKAVVTAFTFSGGSGSIHSNGSAHSVSSSVGKGDAANKEAVLEAVEDPSDTAGMVAARHSTTSIHSDRSSRQGSKELPLPGTETESPLKG